MTRSSPPRPSKSNMDDETHEETYNRLGKCEVCGSDNAIYSCPRCEIKTCSLNCVSIHKKELECSGERDKTGYIPLAEFTNLTLLSDYRFLEDVSRAVDNCKRNPLKRCTRFKRPLPPHLWKLRATALKRQTTLHFLPQHFTRHKENTTQLNFKTGVIWWKVDFVFPQGDNIRVCLEKCDENDRLSFVLSKLIDYEKCPELYRHHLRFYHARGLSGVEVLLKAENVKTGNSFFLLDLSLSLKENFEKVVIIENPIMYVILKDHKDEYTILDPDDDHYKMDHMNAKDSKNFSLFHYFDAVTYTNNKVSQGEEAAKSIQASAAELKKYFAAGDSDMSDDEGNIEKNGSPPVEMQQNRTFKLDIPKYEDLIKQT